MHQRGKLRRGIPLRHKCLKRERGAVVVSRDMGLDRQILVDDTREALAKICSNWFCNPEKALKLIGVTGTNGKTTIATTIKKFF